MTLKSTQDLVTMRIPRDLRDALKELAKKQQRTMVSQIRYMIEQGRH